MKEVVWIPNLIDRSDIIGVKIYDHDSDEAPIFYDMTSYDKYSIPNTYGVLVDIIDGVANIILGLTEPVEEVMEPPSDIEKYKRQGCDTNGGNYCTIHRLYVWNGQLYHEITSTREYFPGEKAKYLAFTPAGLFIVDEDTLDDLEYPQEHVFTKLADADSTIEPLTRYGEWVELKKKVEKMWEDVK
ncbi:hypothetical protein [Pyrococcus kukulkanii]|uniref:Uncharacterized protein n=1 Tax=Pyrococcus kukulkanii TaxID=1609559 RepID=A0ABV4T7T3_9EURY